MSDVRYYEVKGVPPAALNYAIWRAMADARFRVPDAMKPGAAEFAGLHPDDQKAVSAFGERAWAFVYEQAELGTNPLHEASARKRIDAELPCLDHWTREVCSQRGLTWEAMNRLMQRYPLLTPALASRA